MKLLIVRHAESKGNASGSYSTLAHDALSPLGWQQAATLAERLQAQAFDDVVVSPQQRALETIVPYLQATGRRGEIWPEISEACWQPEEEEATESWNTRPASVPDELASLFHFRDGRAIRAADPETFGEGVCRARQAVARLEEMAAAAPDRSVLMATHGHFIRELLNLFLDTRRRVLFGQDNCGLTSLTFDGTWKMNFCNRPGGE